MAIREANLSEKRFALPAADVCSWITIGILKIFALTTTGNDAKPPNERIALGLIFVK
jgi:hypothetical protein